MSPSDSPPSDSPPSDSPPSDSPPSDSPPSDSPPFDSSLTGFSLIELLVALSLLSIVLLGGFFFFNTTQEGYLRQAGYSSQIRAAKAAADKMFIAFHDNASITPATTPFWPADDAPDTDGTADNESHFTLTNIWGDAPWLDASGDYQCRLVGIDTTAPGFTIPAACHAGAGVTTAMLEAMLQSGLGDEPQSGPQSGPVGTLPMAILIGASEACIIEAVATSGGETQVTVANRECLSDASDAPIRAAAPSGSGVILPRFISRGVGRAAILTTFYFGHPGVERGGAGLAFGIDEAWRDTSSGRISLTSNRGADNFSSRWVHIGGFDEANALAVIPPRQGGRFTLFVEPISIGGSAGTTLALDDTGATAETPLYRRGLTLTGLNSLLNSLHIRRAGADEAILRFHLGGGDMVWQRELKLVLE